jgi:predicted MFS family arabinose efflux permease
MIYLVGMLVVSLNTLPYHMLSNFHADETVRTSSSPLKQNTLVRLQYKNKDGSKRGIGVDCSLLNACYFLGELIVAASLGPILDQTGVNTCMLVGAVFSLLGNLTMCYLFYYNK